MATTDPLTGCFNRRYWFDLALRETERSQRFNTPLAIIMTDLDHFKAVNDTYGHLVGDVVLMTVAKRLAENIRSVDVLGRYGGEEFSILLPGAALKEAQRIAERLRRSVAKSAVETEERDIPLTISLGVTCLRPGADAVTITDLIEKADKALYNAKQQGRNRVSVWNKDLL